MRKNAGRGLHGRGGGAGIYCLLYSAPSPMLQGAGSPPSMLLFPSLPVEPLRCPASESARVLVRVPCGEGWRQMASSLGWRGEEPELGLPAGHVLTQGVPPSQDGRPWGGSQARVWAPIITPKATLHTLVLFPASWCPPISMHVPQRERGHGLPTSAGVAWVAALATLVPSRSGAQ